MAEEQRCQAPPEGHRLCANNCGFFGSPATLNLCSKCYRDYCLKEEQASSAKIAVEKSLAGGSTNTTTTTTTINTITNSTLPLSLSSPSISLPDPTTTENLSNPVSLVPESSSSTPEPTPPPSGPTRCSTCKRKVGLTGFRCRCGITFCGTHRYPEQHGCTFDFKSVGRDAIAKANPLVIAEKLERI